MGGHVMYVTRVGGKQGYPQAPNLFLLLPPCRLLFERLNDATLSEEIGRLHAEHRRYAQRLEELIQKPYLSADEQLEEVRLKKLKLHAKDLIFALEHRAAVVA